MIYKEAYLAAILGLAFGATLQGDIGFLLTTDGTDCLFVDALRLGRKQSMKWARDQLFKDQPFGI